jgi:hypothetical protein
MPKRIPSHRPRQLPGNRQSASKRGYGSDWRTIRSFVLGSRPLCEKCKLVSSTEVDHIIPLRNGGTIIRVEFVRIIKGNSRERATLDHLPDPKSVVRPSAAGFDLNQILTKLSPEEKDLCIEILIHGNSCANYAEIRGICAKKVTRDVAKLKERIKCMIS